MQLDQLIESASWGIPGQGLEIVSVGGSADVEIHGVTGDSRRVLPGSLFVAWRGLTSDGHRYISDALVRGAAAVVGEQTREDLNVPYVQEQLVKS